MEEQPKSQDNLRFWNALKRPPTTALRQISGGRLSGKTDINPQWRYEAMTKAFGPCGTGWKYSVNRVWNEPGHAGQVFAFADISLCVKIDDAWSDPIPGIGGSMLIEKEKAGLHSSDEGYKMAITDALSVAMKMIGIAADIYAGLWDGSKYKEPSAKTEYINQDQLIEIQDLLKLINSDGKPLLKHFEVESIEKIPAALHQRVLTALKKKVP